MKGEPSERGTLQRARRALRESEERFRGVFDNAPIGMALIDEGRHFIKVNRALCTMLGHDEKDLVGMPFDAVALPDDLVERVSRHESIWAGTTASYRIDERFVRQDGGMLWVSVTASVVREVDGQPLYGLCMVEDVTVRKRAEERLEYQAYLLANVQEAIIATDADFVIKSWNAAAERTYGYEAEEAIGRPLAEIVVVVEPRPDMPSALREDGSFHGELGHRRKDGSIVWVEGTVLALPEQDGTVAGFVGTFRDVSEHRQAMHALEESEQRLRTLAAHATDLVFRYRLHPRPGFDYASPAARALTGWSDVELCAPDGPGLAIAHPEHRQRLERLLRLEERTDEPVRLRWLRKDGGWLWVELRVAAIADAQGRIVAAEGIARDVTEIERLETELDRARAMAVLARLTAGTAHELAQELAPQGTQKKAPLDVNEALRSMLLVAERQGQPVVEVRTLLEPGLPRVPALGAELRQALLLVVAHAHVLAAAGGGKGTLTVSTRKLWNGVEIHIVVGGAGVAEGSDAQSLGAGCTRQTGWRGTGLRFAHDIVVEQHGGSMQIEAEPGKGVTFVLSLPLAC